MPITFIKMRFPLLQNISKKNEILTSFAGYDHRMSCSEGNFYFEKNMTANHFPYLSSRERRGIEKTIENYLGGIDVNDTFYYAAGTSLYKVGDPDTVISGITLDSTSFKTFVKMGAYIVVFPDKVWYNTKDETSGNIEASKKYTNTSITFKQVNSKGEPITLWNGSGDPPDGAYKIDTKDGKSVLKVYSATAKTWANVATTYFQIEATGIGTNFKKGDGVKITLDLTGITWDRAKDIFVNDEGNGKRSSNFAIYNLESDKIVIVGLLDAATKTFTLPSIDIERKCPDMAFVVECQNRLWGCDLEGHEIYASKLGDPTNWNCFAGISTDSWTATVGSEGEFTGAYSYLGNPIFFKEETILKVSISAYGAHSYRETVARGVQKGSGKSLAQVNELLYYKSPTSVCVYDGNFPQEIGAEFGDIQYENAVGGGWDNKYYISMEDDDYNLFVYNTENSMWAREDNTQVYDFINGDNKIFMAVPYSYTASGVTHVGAKITAIEAEGYSTNLEPPIDWVAESGFVGYTKSDKLYISRFDIRMKMEVGAECKMFIEYDSSGRWEYVWEIVGKGTKSFAIPVRPRRCDHFRYRLVGHGKCTLITVAKQYSEGSDL